ncbi:hypothetical protein BH11PLA2_BH11PLA2_32400 [soil metagenome]
MTLATLWQCPASEVLRTMPADEWPLWVAASALWNLGPRGDDQRAGVIAAVTRNAMSSGARCEPADFFPHLRPVYRPRQPGERGRVDPGLRGFLGGLARGL